MENNAKTGQIYLCIIFSICAVDEEKKSLQFLSLKYKSHIYILYKMIK